MSLIIDRILSYKDILYKNSKIRNGIYSYKEAYGFKEKSNKKLFIRILTSLLEEADLTLSLFPNVLVGKEKILEIGGGIGLVYVYLKMLGFDITSIEPGEPGYNKSYKTGLEIMKILNINSSEWYNYKAEELGKLNKQFDYIISNNVLEHIPKLEDAILAMKLSLKKDGIMIHSCPNYLIPYECHYNSWLIPIFPKLTKFINNKLKGFLWDNINFITSIRIFKICKNNNLKINFLQGTMFNAFERLEQNVEYRKRQKNLWVLYLILKKFHILNLFKKMPSWLTTPMRFTIAQ